MVWGCTYPNKAHIRKHPTGGKITGYFSFTFQNVAGKNFDSHREKKY